MPNWGFRNKLLSQIEPIPSGGVNFQGREDITKYVEWSVREACQIFFDKNIKTELNSANKGNVNSSCLPHIILDFSSLSDGNKKIATQFGSLATDSSGNPDGWIVLNIAVTDKTNAGAIHDHFVKIAEEFEPQ